MPAVRGRIVCKHEIVEDGVVAWEADTISYVGPARPTDADLAPSDNYILPGLVDEHVHGGGGESFPDAVNKEEVARAAHEHIRHGTTRLAATLSTMELDRMEFSAGLLADACDTGLISAINIEGPFLSTERAGAQNGSFITGPDISAAASLLEAARGYAWSMTVAPEQEGAAELVRYLVEQGVTPGFGHTNADAAQARHMLEIAVEAFKATGSDRRPVAVHLFNAMREVMHRAPGPVPEYIAAAACGNTTIELIGDGVHIAPSLVKNLVDALGPNRISLITDAMAATGMEDGTYELGGILVHVAEGVARLRGGNLAGGTSHLLDVVRTTWQAGVALPDAVTMASATPARVIGLEKHGELRPGNIADIVITNGQLEPLTVYRDGEKFSGLHG